MPDPVVLPIELTTSQVRPVAYRVLSKKHGLNLKSTALDVLARFLGRQFGVEWRGAKAEKFLDDIARIWKEEDRGLFVDGDSLSSVISVWTNAQSSQASRAQAVASQQSPSSQASRFGLSQSFGLGQSFGSGQSFSRKAFDYQDYFKVVNAQNQRRYTYNFIKKHFELAPVQPAKVIGTPAALVNLFPTRFHLLSDRIFRNDQFQAPVYSDGMNDDVFSITKVTNLLGRPGKSFFLFGQLSKAKSEQQWYLLDDSGKIALDFTESTEYAPTHYFTDGGFVLCYGLYTNERFQVITLGPPTVERRQETKDAYGNLDFYNLTSSATANRIERIDPAFEHVMLAEEKQLDHRLVILGTDIFLDQLSVVDTLRKVLARLAEEPPLALILLGSFISSPFQTSSAGTYREAMSSLAHLLQGVPDLAHKTKIILVPGDNDPWHAAYSSGGTPLWPLEPIPNVFTGRVDRSASDVVWASNPCRLLYLTQEIVIARDNCGQRLRRHSLRTPTELEVETLEAEVSEMAIDATQSELDLDDDAGPRALEELRRQNEINITETPRTRDPDEREARKVIATILDQCHVSPFPLTARPITWEFDMALSMAQWPTMLILGDPTTPQFKETYEGCRVLNPGPFMHGGKAHWLEHSLNSGTTEIMSLA